MAHYFLCLLIQRLILPIILAACCLARPVALSVPYLLFLFYLPFLSIPNLRRMRSGSARTFYRLLLLTTIITFLLQVAFHIFLAVVGNETIVKCEFLETLLRHIGFVRLDELSADMVVLWLIPEIFMLITSIVIYIIIHTIVKGHLGYRDAETGAETLPVALEHQPIKATTLQYMIVFAKILSVGSLLIASALQPSVTSGVYFILFLGCATWWGCHKELEKPFAVILRIATIFLLFHITTFLAYQNPWPQEFLPVNDTITRILGFTPIMSSTCSNGSDIRTIEFNTSYDADHYLNPVILILTYYILSITSNLLFQQKTLPPPERTGPFGQLEKSGMKHHPEGVEAKEPSRMGRKNMLRKTLTSSKWRGAARKVKEIKTVRDTSVPNERTPLLSGTRKVRDVDGKEVEDVDEIPMNNLDERLSETPAKQSIFEQIFLAVGGLVQFIYKNSYIFTNVIMMTWSIMYHSWITFVLLLWANLIWIIPNQRKHMLRSSPFLVMYAELLLIANYIYGMNLTEDELPTTVNFNGINLSQLGFVKYTHYPGVPLILKSIFTTMFWISLRQMIQERKSAREKTTLADMVAPLQVTMGAATSVLTKTEGKSSPFIEKAGKLINSFLIKFWIWIVAITLFVSGITGTRMTGFRIIYMALFLIFVLTFQFSFKTWRRIMYIFWLIVIVYSMLILVLVYTYQFDKFDVYWEEYVKIPIALQKDIGLEIYKTKQLFLHLVNPTFIVIVTVIQLHYCHKKFMDISGIPTAGNSIAEDPLEPVVNSSYGSYRRRKSRKSEPSGSISNTRASEIMEDLGFRKLSKQEITGVLNRALVWIKEFAELVLLFCEIHFMKVILFTAFMLSVNYVSFVHVIFVILTVLCMKLPIKTQLFFSRVISLGSAIILVLTMIYQIEYIDQADYQYNCTDMNDTTKYLDNNAVWFGFRKADDTHTLSDLIRSYLVYIILVTIHSVIILRQTIKRLNMGLSRNTPAVLFPHITRDDADRDIAHIVKYLFNYGFYKFGVEICMMLLITTIGYRMDVVALMYAGWLATMFHMDRYNLDQIWTPFKWFIIIIIPIQYISLVGAPPGLCVDYPWSDKFFDNFQIWGMLPQNTYIFKESGSKMIWDFILLLFMSRQSLVFKIERKFAQNPDHFPGGSNKSVLKDIDSLGTNPAFVNPTPDFVTKIRNWLDVLKRGLFLVFFWFTLAIVFLTGTSRVNLFSIGYLIGSFTFLWQGTDFYLRPIHAILKWWNLLIGYNVVVIAMKTIIQIPGCLFLSNLEISACWIVQLLGITCMCVTPTPGVTNDCEVPVEDSALFWDAVCFGFLILQRRIYCSHYFCHIINETKASTILASRGAELIEELRSKDMKQEAERERYILEKIKTKMDRIKATQQKILEPIREPTTHADETTAPLARRHSLSSCAGYHTPIDDELAGSLLNEGENISELPSDINGLGPPSRGESILQTQAPSPSSAIMTVSLDGYLEPQRLSFSSPPEDEFVPRVSSPDDTFPVFSPPPPREPPTQKLLMPVAPPSHATAMQMRQHRRQSSLNTVSWPQNELVVVQPKQRHMSTSLHPTEERDGGGASSDISQPVKLRPHHRRQSSIGTSFAQEELSIDHRRRSSIIGSWVIDDDNDENDDNDLTTRSGRARKYSWGPVGELGFRESILSASSKSPVSHHESIRSGDYYMFKDVEDEFELDILSQKSHDSDEEESGKKMSLIRRLSKRQSLGQFMAKIREKAENDCLDKLEQDMQESNATKRRSSSPAIRHGKQQTADSIIPERSTISEPLPRRTQFEFEQMRKKSMVPHDEFTQPDGQQPSTSKQSDEQSLHEDDDEQTKLLDEQTPTKKKPKKKIILSGLQTVLAFFTSVIVSITIRLHHASRSYRYVMRVLAREKISLKSQPGFGAGQRTGSGNMWTPLHGPGRSQSSSSSVSDPANKANGNPDDDSIRSEDHPLDERIASAKFLAREREYCRLQPLEGLGRAMHKMQDAKSIERRISVVPEIRIVAPSIEGGLDESYKFSDDDDEREMELSKDEFVDKMSIDDDDEDFSSKEHSLLVELLQAAWYAILSHTDFICYFFVFLNQINSASVLSLPLPLLVLLWGTLTFPRPSKTFWVTLIAYTQTVVLIKCVSQFEMLWWNQGVLPISQPFSPAKIIGIERKKNYATFDLIQLLVVFCHRFILKSLGLWKSDFVEEMVPDGFYKVDEADPQSIEILESADNGELNYDYDLSVSGSYSDSAANSSDNLLDEDFINDALEERQMLENNHSYRAAKSSFFRQYIRGGLLQSRKDTFMYMRLLTDLILNDASITIKSVKHNTVVEIKKLPDELKLHKLNSDSILAQENRDRMVFVNSTLEEPSHYCPSIIRLSMQKYGSSIKAFFGQLLPRESRKTADVYGYMFLCDFINFFVIIFGFSSFGTQEGDGGVMTYFDENKVPMSFLVMLFLQFVLIVIDRALYLRKFMPGKIVFQFILIFGLHIWMFFILPATTDRSFNATVPPILYYLIKCFYLLFSAYQIRCGYPARILGNFLTKGFTMINFLGFKVFMLAPFLFELRTTMDWIWTDTSMTFFDWLKMEDIFANIFQLKCMRQLESDLPAPRGQKKGTLVKYLMGGFFMLMIVGMIWFPLALFAFSNAVGQPNLPFDVTVSLKVGPYESVYTMSAQDSDIHKLNDSGWHKMLNTYSKDKAALTFLSNYEPYDVAAVVLGINSASIWNISPPDRMRLVDDLINNETLTCRFNYVVSRKTNSIEEKGVAMDEQSYQIGKGSQFDEIRTLLINMLDKNDPKRVTIPNMFPKFLKVKNSGVLRPIHQLVQDASTDDDIQNYRDLSLKLFQTGNASSGEIKQFWWEVKEVCDDKQYIDVFSSMPFSDCQNSLVIYTFNDKQFPSTISSLAAGGIIGIYSTGIFLLFRLLRTSFYAGSSAKIMFEDLPYVDRVLQLCLDIYLVRESLEFALEEDLFAKLIFLYRSPETMIKWTRAKNEPSNEDDDDDADDSSTARPSIEDKKNN